MKIRSKVPGFKILGSGDGGRGWVVGPVLKHLLARYDYNPYK